MTSTAEYRRVLIDTSAWIALANTRDQFHAPAVAFHRSLGPLVARITTWGIVSETYTWIRYHRSYREAETWLHGIADLRERRVLHSIYPTEATDAGVDRILSHFSDQTLSYVDGFTLYLATKSEVDAIFAFDHHMSLAGVPLLPGQV
jgi:predicted nucleic acid-binding protein